MRALVSIFLYLSISVPSFCQQPKLLLPAGHAALLTQAVFNPDGKFIATASGDEENLVKVWEARSGKLLYTLEGHTEKITSLSFSPDGKFILTTGHDNYARVWDANTGLLNTAIRCQNTNWIENGFFIKGGKEIILVTMDLMEDYESNTGKFIKTIFDSALLKIKDANALARSQSNFSIISPDKKWVATANNDSTIKIWDIKNGKLFKTLVNIPTTILSFSSDSKYIAACATANAVVKIDVAAGKVIQKIKAGNSFFLSAFISPDNKTLLACALDTGFKKIPSQNKIEVFDLSNGNLLQTLKPEGFAFSIVFSKSGNEFLSVCLNGTIQLWDSKSGKSIRTISARGKLPGEISEDDIDQGKFLNNVNANFSDDSKRIVSFSLENIAKVSDAATGKVVSTLEGISTIIYNPAYSPDGKMIVTSSVKDLLHSPKGIAQVWNLETGKLLQTLEGHTSAVDETLFSNDGKFIVTASQDSSVKVWDSNSGKMIYNFTGHDGPVYEIYLTPDDKYLVSQSFSNSGRIWDLASGKLISIIKHDSATADKYGIYNITMSGSGKYFKTVFYDDYTATITETATGKKILQFAKPADSGISLIKIHPAEKLIFYCKKNTVYANDIITNKPVTQFSGHTKEIQDLQFSADGKLLATTSKDSTVKIWDISSGKILLDIKPHKGFTTYVGFNPNGKILVTQSYDDSLKLWDVASGKLIYGLTETKGDNGFYTWAFTKDNKYLITQSFEKDIRVWDLQTGKNISSMPERYTDSYHINPVKNQLIFDNKFSIDVYNLNSSILSFRIIPTTQNDYIVVDSTGRYDGTEASRKLLYYTCGTEIIELDQVKDLCWEPNLIAKINGINSEPISAKSLNELNICGLSPVVEEKGLSNGSYHFIVTPRNGGLGDVVLSVNNAERKRFHLSQLKKTGNSYELIVPKESLAKYFINDEQNSVSVKAYTSDNVVTSRYSDVLDEEPPKAKEPTNLFAISIGVSQYKDEKLNLHYAAKDAADFINALAPAAKKLLNTDSVNRVFAYPINSGSVNKPFKNEIKKAFTEIGKKAKAGDVVVIFFAGHGSLSGENKDFYLLTAEATSGGIKGVEKEVAISTTELFQWMDSINANKKVLILDACNSGQLISSITKRDVPADQQRALETLKDRSGTFILTASASGQYAYEASQYAQGLLTYSLLEGMKYGKGLKENKYLDVSSWFNYTADEVKDMARAINGRQEPQIFGRASFSIGLVDEEVAANINLAKQKIIFTRSSFQNEDIMGVDLNLSSLIDKKFNELSVRSVNTPVDFIPDINVTDAYNLKGRYTIQENNIVLKAYLFKGQNTLIDQFEWKGDKNNLAELSTMIVDSVWNRLLKK